METVRSKQEKLKDNLVKNWAYEIKNKVNRLLDPKEIWHTWNQTN